MSVARKMLASLPQVAASKLTVEVPVQATSLGTARDEAGLTLERTLDVPKSVDSAGFYAAVKQRVNAYFDDSGLQSRGGPIMLIKSCVTLSLLAAAWYLACVEGRVWAAPLLGILMAVCGLSIQHDANHGALSSLPTVNWLFGMVDDLIGGSSLAWRHQHMVAHHADPNDAGLDPDTYHQWPLIRFNPAMHLKSYHCYQHVYGPALYTLMGIAYGFGDIATVLSGAYGHVQLHKMRLSDQMIFWGGKAVHFGLFYGVPMYLFGPLTGLLTIVLPAQLVGGYFLASTFAVSHNSTGAAYNVPRNMDFGEMQTRTAVNWSVWGDCPSYLAMFWLLIAGGLNYQIEHHLFPGVAHIHYPQISRIVRAVCEEWGVPYNSYSTFADIYVEHIKTLYLLGNGKDTEVLKAMPRCLRSCKAVEGAEWTPIPGEDSKTSADVAAPAEEPHGIGHAVGDGEAAVIAEAPSSGSRRRKSRLD